MTTDLLSLPSLDDAQVVVPAPGAGPGNWAGAASAVLVDDEIYLTYRVRRPLTEGRGVAVVVARSKDGIALRAGLRGVPRRVRRGVLRAARRTPTPRRRLAALRVVRHPRDQALVDRGARRGPARGPAQRQAHRRRARRRPGGRQGPGHRGRRQPVAHVDLRASAGRPRPRGPDDAPPTPPATTGSPGPGAARCCGRAPATWDARGARVTAVLSLEPLVVLYDGRPRAEDNWHETTGVAHGQLGGVLMPDGAEPMRSPYSDGAFRYATRGRPSGRHARGSTSRSRGPTARTTWSPRSARRDPRFRPPGLERAAVAVALPVLERLPRDLSRAARCPAGAAPGGRRAVRASAAAAPGRRPCGAGRSGVGCTLRHTCGGKCLPAAAPTRIIGPIRAGARPVPDEHP